MRNTQANVARASELRKLGIPIDAYELERMKPAPSGLFIAADLELPGFVSNCCSQGTGYVFGVTIWNDSECRLAPVHIVFRAPKLATTGIQLLADPRKSPTPPIRKTPEGRYKCNLERNTYAFPGSSQELYPRDSILNHRIGPSAYLYPGDELQGFLLAVSDSLIPPDYTEGQRVATSLTLFDQCGFSRRCTVHLVVRRSKKEREFLEDIEFPDAPRARNKWAEVAQRVARRGFGSRPGVTMPTSIVALESEDCTPVCEESHA